MPSTPSRVRRRKTAALALMTATMVPGLAQIPALATSPSVASTDLQHVVDGLVATLGDTVPGLSDLDLRGRVLPTAAQRSAADRLGAVTLRWNDFGTPASLLPADGALARATSADPVAAARAYLEDNAALFGLTRAAMAGLELVNEQKLADSPDAKGRPTAPAGHAVLFRQRFGDLSPALGSMVTVGVSRGEIAYVSSSLVRTTQAAPAATLTPLEGWVEAAGNVGRSITDSTLKKIGTVVDRAVGSVAPWTRLAVPGFSEQQQVRLRALAMADGTVRPVYEANVVDNQDGLAFAYTLMVDAVTGDVLHRAHQVENDSVQEVYQGTFSSTECGPKHAFELTDDLTTTLNAAALARDEVPQAPPRTTAIGALGHYVSHADPANYQPSNIAFGLIPVMDGVPRRRAERRRAIAERALTQIEAWRAAMPLPRDHAQHAHHEDASPLVC